MNDIKVVISERSETVLKDLTDAAVGRTRENLHVLERADIMANYLASVPHSERDAYPFRSFFSDLVYEAAYRAVCGAPDGNWFEFARDHHLTEDTFRTILNAMIKAGFDEMATEW